MNQTPNPPPVPAAPAAPLATDQDLALEQAIAAADQAGRSTRWLTYALIVLGGLAFLAINAWYVVKTQQDSRKLTELVQASRQDRARMDEFVRAYTKERRQQGKIIEARQIEIRNRQVEILKKIDLLLGGRGK